ncbi:MAG TPA: hypothetical protein VKY26_02635 [Actinomycetota bacterium]|nr:hypothetical protein [Actinomycetota bacterium]
MEPLDDGLTLEEVIDLRGVPRRDCRDCSQFTPDAEGRAFGWCSAHKSFVKLYHSETDWHSQCQFKTLRLVRKVRPLTEPEVGSLEGVG